MPRISVIGGPGTGKTTFAARAAAITGASHIELDALWWGPGWTPVDPATFEERVRHAVQEESWVIEGFYLDEAARPLIWPRAECIVWLDIPRRTAVVRALRRSALRVVRRTELWGTNTQAAGVLAPRSIISFVRRWPSYASRIGEELGRQSSDKAIVRLRNDSAKDAWLSALAPNVRSGS